MQTAFGRTIHTRGGFQRVTLTSEEFNKVYDDVMNYNVEVLADCLRRAEEAFSAVEPDRRVRLAVKLADKAMVAFFSAQANAVSAKVSSIKDAENKISVPAARGSA